MKTTPSKKDLPNHRSFRITGEFQVFEVLQERVSQDIQFIVKELLLSKRNIKNILRVDSENFFCI